ncbi:MAG: ACP S-malonyltransferase [Aureliella sp.]
MGAELAARSSIAKDLFSTAAEILGYDLLDLCTNGPVEKLNRTEFGQPALFVHSYAALKQLEHEQPDLWSDVACVAGLSLGEYTAVAAAGGLSFEDGVKLVQIRGRAMQEAADTSPSGMASVIGLAADQLREICSQASEEAEFVKVANLLCPGNIAISGHLAAIDRAATLCSEAGAMKVVRLQVAGAFHTSIMAPAIETLQAAVDSMDFSDTSVPVYSNVDALPHVSPEQICDLLARQVVAPVLWEDSLRNMIQAGVEQFIELGAGRVLAGTLKRVKRKMPCQSIGS